MTVVLVVALTLPAFAVLATVAVASRRAGAMLALGGAVTAIAWSAVLIGGGATVGRFHAPPLVAAAATGAGLIAASVSRRRRLERVLPVGLALGALPAGLTLGLVEGRGGVLVVTLAIVAVLVVAADRGKDLPLVALAAVIGLAWLTVGLVSAHATVESWTLVGALPPGVPLSATRTLPTFATAALLIGCAALVTAGTLRARPVDALLLIGGTTVAIRVAGAFTGPTGPVLLAREGIVPWLALVLVAAAVAAAAVAPPPVAIALLALAAVAGPTAAVGAAALLAAAALLCVLSTVPWTVGAALPGAVAMALALRHEPGVVSAGMGLGLALVAGLFAWRLRLSEPAAPRLAALPPVSIVASLLAVWLAAAPRAWSWTAPGALHDYQRGALLALSGGLLVLIGGAWWAWRSSSRPRHRPAASVR